MTQEFNDHIVQHPNRFKQTTVAPGVVELVPTWQENPNEIVQLGTPVDRQLFNGITSQLADIATNASLFGFVGDGVADDTIPFTNMINSEYSTILFPPNGVYKITDTILNNAGGKKKILFNNARLIVDFTTTKNFIRFYRNVELHDVVIDFNNNHCGNGLFYEENLGELTLKNVTIENIYDRTLNQTIVVCVKSAGNSLNFDKVTLRNLKKFGDGTETTIFEGIFVNPAATPQVINGGKMSNITIDGFHRVNAGGTIIKDIGNAIYLSAGLATNKEANVSIEKLKAYNFGKRLLKAQVSALTVNGVYAESNTDDAMTGLSFQDLDSIRTNTVYASDIVLRGKMRFGINISSDKTIVDKVDIDIQPATLHATKSIGLSLAGDDCLIASGSVKASIPVFGNRTKSLARGPVKNVEFGPVTLIAQNGAGATATIVDWITTVNEPFNGLTFRGTVIERNADDGLLGINLGNATDTSYNLTFDGVTFIDNSDLTNSNYAAILQKITGVRYRNVVHRNRRTGTMFRSFQHTSCTNVSMDTVDCDARAQLTANSFLNCTDVLIKALKGHASTTYLGSFSNTDASIQSSNMAKMIFNDAFSVKNKKYLKNQTFGATADRPTSPFTSDEHFDTTLGKPVWWNGTVWKDANGTTV